MLRQKLPKTALASSEVKKVMRTLRDAKPTEFDASMEQIGSLIQDIEVRLKKNLIKKALKKFRTLAATKVDQSGKKKSKGRVDAESIRFFGKAEEVLKAYINNYVDAINRRSKYLYWGDHNAKGDALTQADSGGSVGTLTTLAWGATPTADGEYNSQATALSLIHI